MCTEAVQIGEKLGFNFISFFFYRWGDGEGSCSFPVGSQCHMNVQWLLHLFYAIKFTMLHTWLIFFFHWTLVHNALYLIISDVNDERQHYDLHWGPTDLLSWWVCPLAEWPILQWSIKASVNMSTGYLSTSGSLSHAIHQHAAARQVQNAGRRSQVPGRRSQVAGRRSQKI